MRNGLRAGGQGGLKVGRSCSISRQRDPSPKAHGRELPPTARGLPAGIGVGWGAHTGPKRVFGVLFWIGWTPSMQRIGMGDEAGWCPFGAKTLQRGDSC